MLTSLRIQNFRSIRDASVKLGQVNLFIGPNNSGKSNCLKSITMLGAYLSVFPKGYPLSETNFQVLLPRAESLVAKKKQIMRLSTQMASDDHWAVSLIIGYAIKSLPYSSNADDDEEEEVFSSEIDTTIGLDAIHDFKHFFEQPGYSSIHDIPTIIWKAQKQFYNIRLYKLEPAAFIFSTSLSDQPFLESNGSNITPFLFTLSQNHENNFAKLRSDLAQCVGSLVSVSTPPDPNIQGNLRLKFFDREGHPYWAEEVSEGVLYFLALLCIVHQPDPPKLLLLEEPEKGIHPRRIEEVMDFIFELARLRDIQIILTSHSPYVVDRFKDLPECISIFDRKDGETVIHNAADIMKETNDKLEAAGQKPIRYTDALGEYWVSGFLGGVPL